MLVENTPPDAVDDRPAPSSPGKAARPPAPSNAPQANRLEACLRAAQAELGLQAFRFVYLNESGQPATVYSGVPATFDKAERDILGLIESNAQPVLIGNAAVHPAVQSNPLVAGGPRLGAIAGCRISTSGSKRSGVVAFYQASPVVFGPEHRRALDRLADALAMLLRAELSPQSEHASERTTKEGDLYKTLFEAAPVGIVHVALDGTLLRVNAAFCKTMGRPRASFENRKFTDFTHPDDVEESEALFKKLFSDKGKKIVLEKRYMLPTGAFFWARVTRSLQFDAAGEPLYCISIVEDISDRKAAEDRQSLMLRELNHRVKNTLAMISAIAHQSSHTSQNMAAFLEGFELRVQSLASAHNLLTHCNWANVPLEELVHQQVIASAGGHQNNISISGPPIALNPELSLNVGLVLHELSTNAMKYGALSGDGGRLSITWDRVDRDGEIWIDFRWVEECGRPITPGPSKGFGSFLLDEGLRLALGGTSERHFGPQGLRCRLELPVY